MQITRRALPGWDLLGVGISGACAVHCVAAPVVLAVLPALGERLIAPWVHSAFVVVLLPVALAAFWCGLRRHNRLRATLIGAVGAALVLFVVTSEWRYSRLLITGWSHFTLNLIGSGLLILAHLLNVHDLRLADERTASCDCCPP